MSTPSLPLSLPTPTPTPTASTSGHGGGSSAVFVVPGAPGAAAAAPVAATGSVAATAQVAPILAAAQAALASSVNLSPQAQQAIKAEAFSQLVSQLVQQLPTSSVLMPERWPAGGVTPQWQALLSALVQQATAGQALPQQLVAMQSWPTALMRAVLQEASGQGAANNPPPAGSGAATNNATGQAASQAAGTASGAAQPASSAAAGAATTGAAAPPPRPAIPALQNWLVQQGVLLGPDGARAFTLTLKVPVAWAQAQSVLGQALGAGSGAASSVGGMAGMPVGSAGASPAGLSGAMPGAPLAAAPAAGPGAGSSLAAAGVGVGFSASSAGAGVGLQLPFTGSVQQLANTAFGLVLQPQGLPDSQAQAMRASAVLQMDFQPGTTSTTAAQQAVVSAALLPAGMLPQEAYQALLARTSDPWVQMGQLQASGYLPRERPHDSSGHECDRAGCQYQGRAECAQPFCAEMNSLWATSRASRR